MRKKYLKNVVIFSIKLEEFFKKKEKINIFNLFILNCFLLFNFEIISKKNQNIKLLFIFFKKIK